MKRAVLLIAALTVAGACKKNDIGISITELDNDAPAYGDSFIASTIGDASYLNPVLSSDSASGQINSLVYSGLVRYDKDLVLEGELAERWEIRNDGRDIIFFLRQGVKWHDGADFTAEDVEFTYKKLIDPAIKTPYSSDYQMVSRFRILDKYTIRITYNEPFAPALSSWGMGIIPKHIFSEGDFNSHPANRKPVGTGPYKFVEWKTDQKIVLEANKDYFEGEPYIQKYVYRIIPDQSVQFMELRNESIDSMGLTPDQFKAYDEFFKNYNKYRYPSFSYTYMAFNLKNSLFENKKIRHAISHAINKNDIINGVLLGMGSEATGPFVPTSWAFNPDVKGYPYDPDKALEMLHSMGWKDTDKDGWLDKNGKRFEFSIMTNQGNKTRSLCAEIIQENLKRIGIKANIRIVEWSTFIHTYVDKREFDAIILGWNIGIDPDQFSIWHSSQQKEGQYNFVSYSNTYVDRLIEEGRHEFNFEKRKVIYRRIHRAVADDAPYVFLYYADSLPVVHKRFEGVEVAPAGLSWNFTKWYAPAGKQKY